MGISGLQQLSLEEVFYGMKMEHNELHQAHVWGRPTYALNFRLQNGQKLPKSEARTRRCTFLDISPSNILQTYLKFFTSALVPSHRNIMCLTTTSKQCLQLKPISHCHEKVRLSIRLIVGSIMKI